MCSWVQSCFEGRRENQIYTHGYSPVLQEGERTKYVLMGAVLF